MTKKIVVILAILSLVFLLRAWDDEELFKNVSTRLKPNLVLLMDNSNSMSEIVYYPKLGIDGVSGTADDGYDSQQDDYSGTMYNFYNVFSDVPGFNGTQQHLTQTAWYGFVRVGSANAYFHDRSFAYSGTLAAGQIQVTSTIYNYFSGTSSSQPAWINGKTSGAHARVYRSSSGGWPNPTKYYLNLSEVVGTFTANETILKYSYRDGGVFYPIYLYGDLDDLDYNRQPGNDYPWYDPNYVRWFTIHATADQIKAISHFSMHGTFKVADIPDASAPSPTDYTTNPSNCNCLGGTGSIKNKVRKVFTRIQVAREVTCKLLDDNTGPDEDIKIRFALYQFKSDNQGAVCLDPINNLSQAQNDSLKGKVFSMYGDTGTPLAESLAKIWRDFKPGNNKNDYMPVDEKSTGGNSDYMQAYCQGNYVIVVTDGQSTVDNFDHHNYSSSVFLRYPIKRTGTYEIGKDWDYSKGWGDEDSTYDSRPGPSNDDKSRDYCPGKTCWIRDSDGNDWLDDVAYFLSHQDMYPDSLFGTNSLTGWPGDQNIVTYTIGLNTDNDMLRRTASNGGGQYFTSSNFEELSAALQQVINDISIREDEMMFTTFASPKQSVTSGLFGYVATFIPDSNNTVWKGQLKCYELTKEGDFPVGGKPLWDAGRELAARAASDRTIYTVKGGSLVPFDQDHITPQDLDVYKAAEDDPENPLDPNEVRRNTVVDFIRGNNGYTDPYEKDSNGVPVPGTPTGYKLGDIFHFNPLVVSVPLRWKAAFDTSYNTFYEANKTRPEVILVGTNDGMIHCFKLGKKSDGGGSELWAFIPPSQLQRLKYLTSVTSAAERPYYFRYFIDGKGMAKDIKVETSSGVWEWKTFFAFGMGIGGKSYCALDLTDTTTPKFLWELTGTTAGFPMGCTEARPIVADISNGTDTFAAVMLPGGVRGDLTKLGTKPSWDAEAATAAKQEGQALFILKAYSGAMVHKVTYGASTSAPSIGDVPAVYTLADLKYQIAAPPSVLDRNNDGVADYIYFFETGSNKTTTHYGGRLWKMNLTGAPHQWVPQKIYQASDGQTLYLGSTLGYDMSNRLWVMFGSGNRADITARDASGFVNPSGQFVALYDNFALSVPVTNTELKDITSWFTTLPTNPSFSLNDYSGFRFDFTTFQSEVFYEPMPLLLNNWIYMNTFSPETPELDPDTVYLCSAPPITGYHNIYKFHLASSGNNVSIPETYSTPGKILGFGLLSSGKYKVYSGASTPGGFGIAKSETITLDDIFGPVVWKENKK